MAKFLFACRVPKNYEPGAETGQAWQAWFEGLGSSRIDTGHGVIGIRALGDQGGGTRLGGYSVVEAEDIDSAAALAEGCPALALGGGVENGAIPEFAGDPRARTGA